MISSGNSSITLGALNCQGLADKVDLPEFADLLDKMDICGVSETWLNTQKADEISVPGFNFYPFNRKTFKGAIRGGVGIFIKKELKKYVKIRLDLSNENFLWCKIKKEYIGYREDLYICMVYIPPECSTREIREKMDHFKILENTTSKIDSDNIILLGDFNARTQTLDDTITKSKGDDSLPTQFYSKVTSKRCNQDLSRNKYGQKLTEYCIASGMYIANGRTLGDLQGKKTCFQSNGTSTVDYAIVNDKLSSKVLKFQVLDPYISDHSPIIIQVRSANIKCQKQSTSVLAPAMKWNETTELALNCKLRSEETLRTIEEVNNLLDRNEDIDLIVEKVSAIYDLQGKSHHSIKSQKT